MFIQTKKKLKKGMSFHMVYFRPMNFIGPLQCIPVFPFLTPSVELDERQGSGIISLFNFSDS